MRCLFSGSLQWCEQLVDVPTIHAPSLASKETTGSALKTEVSKKPRGSFTLAKTKVLQDPLQTLSFGLGALDQNTLMDVG